MKRYQEKEEKLPIEQPNVMVKIQNNSKIFSWEILLQRLDREVLFQDLQEPVVFM